MIDSEYGGSERRKFDRTVAEAELAFSRQLHEHELREEERLRFMLEEFAKEAFPDGAGAHKHAHQVMIDAAKAEEAFWRDLRSEMMRKSIWGILKILAVLATAGLFAKLGLWPAYVAWLAGK